MEITRPLSIVAAIGPAIQRTRERLFHSEANPVIAAMRNLDGYIIGHQRYMSGHLEGVRFHPNPGELYEDITRNRRGIVEGFSARVFTDSPEILDELISSLSGWTEAYNGQRIDKSDDLTKTRLLIYSGVIRRFEALRESAKENNS